MTSDAFAEFLTNTVLKEVSIRSVHVDRPENSVSHFDELLFGEQDVLVSASDNMAVIDKIFGIKCIHENIEVATLEVTYRVTYQTPKKMDAEAFKHIRGVTLRLHTVPFAREWFRDISGRMGLPPIILPLAIAHPAAIPNDVRKVEKAPGKIAKTKKGGR